MKQKWRIIKTIETNGALQMATDEAILTARINKLVPNTLRFFTWKPSCLSIGYFQSLQKEVDEKKAKEQGVDIVRRYTGGGAVFHDKELTYSLTISEKDLPTDIIASYEKICQALIKGLQLLGLQATFKPINDVLVNNKKVSGNAQTRKNKVVLQHGTILLDVNVKKMFSLLTVPNEKIKDKLIQKAEERVSALRKELGREISKEELEEALITGFQKVFNITFEESTLTDYELKLAKQLYEEKYTTTQWSNSR